MSELFRSSTEPPEPSLESRLFVYAVDLSIAAVALGLYLHVSDCERNYLSRAELDEHVAAVGLADVAAIGRQGEVLGASRRDVVPPAADCNHADAALRGRPDFRDGNGASAHISDAEAFHGTNDAHVVPMLPYRRECADAGASMPCADDIAHKRVDEVRKWDERADCDEGRGTAFHGADYTTRPNHGRGSR